MTLKDKKKYQDGIQLIQNLVWDNNTSTCMRVLHEPKIWHTLHVFFIFQRGFSQLHHSFYLLGLDQWFYLSHPKTKGDFSTNPYTLIGFTSYKIWPNIIIFKNITSIQLLWHGHKHHRVSFWMTLLRNQWAFLDGVRMTSIVEVSQYIVAWDHTTSKINFNEKVAY